MSDVDNTAHVFVGGNGESVQALGPPEAVGAIREAIAERDRLARWKDEALQVLGTWDLVGVALGSPGALGESRAVAALHAVADLLAERDRLRGAIRVHRESVKCCDECAVAQAGERDGPDGVLWAEVDR